MTAITQSAQISHHLQNSEIQNTQSSEIQKTNPEIAINEVVTFSKDFQASFNQKTGNIICNENGAPQLDDIIISFSAEDMAAALLVLQNKTQQAQITTAQEGLKISKKKLEDQNQRAIEKIQEWTKKCQDAASKQKAHGIFGWIKKIASAVASLVGVVCAAIATVATGGAAAPLLALALLSFTSSCLSIASEIDKARGGKGFDHILEWMDPGSLVGKGVGALAKKLGASENTASIISACAAVATTVAIIVASAIITGGGSAASQASNLSKLAGNAQKIGSIIEAGVGIATGAAQATESGIGISIAADYRDATKSQAEKHSIDANITRILQQMENEHNDIKKMLDEMMDGINIVNQMINSSSESHMRIAENLQQQKI